MFMGFEDCSRLLVSGAGKQEREDLKATSFPRAWHVSEQESVVNQHDTWLWGSLRDL